MFNKATPTHSYQDDCQIRLSVVETYFQNAMGIPLPFILLFVVQTLIFLYVYYNSTFKDEERRYLSIRGNDVTKGKLEGIVKNSFRLPKVANACSSLPVYSN